VSPRELLTSFELIVSYSPFSTPASYTLFGTLHTIHAT
jgi:hypothetical protein